MTIFRILGCATLLALAPLPLAAQGDTLARSARARECPSCAEWNAPQQPFRIHGNTWFVGTRGLSAILITSPGGHVLIDGGLPESASLIEANLRTLGFRMRDVKLILNSHAHFDHAGGIAALQRATGAAVAASAWSAGVMERGASPESDPQHGILLGYPAVSRVRTFADGETLRVGPLALTAHLTPGHTPGGTTWTWRSCDGTRCLEMVYADSQTPVSADDFKFSRNTTYPTALADFERGFAMLEGLRCDVLITPHPGASQLWERVAAGRLADAEACRRYAASARRGLARRIAEEQARP